MTNTTKRVAKEIRLAKIIGGTIPSTVLTYMRKNPRQVYRNFKKNQPIFGTYSSELTTRTLNRVHKNRSTILKGWKSLYSKEQLISFTSTL